jgi:hypothetical protein
MKKPVYSVAVRWLISCCLLFLLSHCTPSYQQYIQDYKKLPLSDQPDYSDLKYWAAHPWKWDPSDSIPLPLRGTTGIDSGIDVFFLYPTSLTNFDDPRWNADLDDASLNAKNDYNSILYQASAFNRYRVFAPRYRQAHIRSYYVEDTANAKKAFEKAYSDVAAAFSYYLDNYNQGRPIILASHSQGSTHAIRLMKEYFDGKALGEKLVAAWVPGMYLPEGTFKQIPLCQDPLQISCYCSWRTFKTYYTPPFTEKEKVHSPVTNPLSWTVREEPAARALNKGALLRNFNKIMPGVADARIEGSILWSLPRFPGSFLMKKKNLHIGDINLFYMNIRENAETRVNEYKKKFNSSSR